MKYLDGGQLILLFRRIERVTHLLSSASAFVSVATMVLFFPVPRYIANKIRDVQVQRMKMVRSCLMFLFFMTDNFKMDARVQDVIEGMLNATMTFH